MLPNHPVVHRRLVERREILALEVLDDRDLARRVVVDVLDERRDRFEPGHLGGTPASLAGDELEAPVAEGADEDRLEDTVLPDRRRQLLEGLLVE
jgi:hypothetical protein